ncbi:unnamed protein product, partial [Heterosigma akashiwo]
LQSEADFEYEEEISRNPYALKSWWRYLDHKKNARPKTRYVVYERALKFLPGSFKLWHSYLKERTLAVEDKSVLDPAREVVANAYERALHHLVWEHYLAWAQGFGSPESCIRVYRRFLMYDPQGREDYVDYLASIGEWGEAAAQLARCVNDDEFGLKVEAIVRSGLARFTDEVGRLWCRLADYHTRLGQLERARDIYEEARRLPPPPSPPLLASALFFSLGLLWARWGVNSVTTVRDFTTLFDAYTQYEEGVLSAKMRLLEEEAGGGEEEEEEAGLADLDADGDDVELRLARLEHLLDRRPLLLSSVLLRQNPHAVAEWHRRAKLFAGDARKVIVCYTEAVKTVDPRLAAGRLSSLWLAFAAFYEEHKDLGNARVILAKAAEVNYKATDELATVFTSWAEMELRHENYDEALKVMQRATTEPPEAVRRRREAQALSRNEGRRRQALDVPVQDRVHKSTKVWALYLDLEESLGTVDTARAAYDKCLALKVATPQMVLNAAAFLEEHGYFEDAFRVYEKGLGTFKFPHVKALWTTYLKKFVERYQGTKMERTRDLFEQCLKDVPAKVQGSL